MAVAFQGANGTQGNGVSSLSWSHNSGTGTDKCMLVTFGSSAFGGAGTHDSATHDGNNMTKVWDQERVDNDMRVSGWVLAFSTNGNKTIVTTASKSEDEFGAASCAVTGAHQTTPARGTGVGAHGNDTTPTVDVTDSSADDLIFDGVYHQDQGTSWTSNQTLRHSETGITGFAGLGLSTAAGSGSTVTMSYSIASDPWCIGAISIQPPAGGGGLSIPVAMHHYQQQKQA